MVIKGGDNKLKPVNTRGCCKSNMIANKYLRICIKGLVFAGILLLISLVFGIATIYRGRHHPQIVVTETCLQGVKPFFRKDYVPRHVHQLFYFAGDKVIPKKLQIAQESWSVMNPTFKHRLWNVTMAENLISKHFPELEELYNSYDHWVSRTDFARLAILYMYGGIYADIDMESKKSLTEFNDTVLNGAKFAVFKTKPSGLSNSFIVSSPGHPFLRHLLCGLPSANKNYLIPYVTILMTAGPEYFNSGLVTYSVQHSTDDVMLIEGEVMRQYVKDFHSGSWHSWDGKIVWWFYSRFIDNGNLWKLICLVLMALSIGLIVMRNRRLNGAFSYSLN